ncbi:hypothetical protein [Emticicia aquatilis]|uniref:hypothetical protein n=1 Tax=Emticicia aquatilis TaxID=1537369 RepID=UPI00166DE98D|nr:hypothetical protein [Emticicia aquatilis]
MKNSSIGTSVAVSGPNGITIYGLCTGVDSSGNPTTVYSGLSTYEKPSTSSNFIKK